MILPIHFAPLQGYTEGAYRRLHSRMFGGIDTYYTSFIRWEKEGVRRKDLREADPEGNAGLKVVPQIIVSDVDEFNRLCDVLQEMGHSEIDINMGCPFPLQTRHGRGAGLLQHEDVVAALSVAMSERSDVRFSLKMRLGQESADESFRLIPMLNEMPLSHITMHPRLGCQQYKGAVDMESFTRFYEACTLPLLYNGDLTTVDAMIEITLKYPRLAGLMLGRGLLNRPSLAVEYATATSWTEEQLQAHIREMHRSLYDYYKTTLQGDTQLLQKLKMFWEYMTDRMDRKAYKKIQKCGSLRNYQEAVANVF